MLWLKSKIFWPIGQSQILLRICPAADDFSEIPRVMNRPEVQGHPISNMEVTSASSQGGTATNETFLLGDISTPSNALSLHRRLTLEDFDFIPKRMFDRLSVLKLPYFLRSCEYYCFFTSSFKEGNGNLICGCEEVLIIAVLFFQV